MRRRPPISTRTDTCLPYTTLLRSVAQPVSAVAAIPETSAARAARSEGKTVITHHLSTGRGRPPRAKDLRRQPLRQGQPSPERRSEEHTSELQSLMRISYAVFCLKKKKQHNKTHNKQHNRA